ncbi:MAG: 4Fe-4S dicluster domain-containing protein [Actinobacteria bacterium]|nr:4Fe-4S dicluster domain-containing protein [Actinomycetota bacterium]
MGFFTDTTVCIGCKACEVACKEWNLIPSSDTAMTGNSYDNTGGLGADTWRHVAFIEQRVPEITAMGVSGVFTGERVARPGSTAAGSAPAPPVGGEPVDLARIGGDGFAGDQTVDRDSIDFTRTGEDGLVVPIGSSADAQLRWLMSSDVCKHCTTAACLDVCPTGSLFKTEFATVVVQPDICNGCGYCVPACPYGVLDRREDDGRVWKCTLCYDRLRDGQEPACAKACPTDSINFGPHADMLAMARERLDEVVDAGYAGAQLYGDGPSGGVDGAGSLFLLLDEPEVYGLPPDPVAPSKQLRSMWRAAAAASGALVAGVAMALLGGRR